jgi:hypothetical protein
LIDAAAAAGEASAMLWPTEFMLLSRDVEQALQLIKRPLSQVEKREKGTIGSGRMASKCYNSLPIAQNESDNKLWSL